MTNKLYLDDSYLAEADAVIDETRGNKVYLSRTNFYPEGGGQLGDTGYIDTMRVIDTQKAGGVPFGRDDFPMIMINGKVAHILGEDSEPLEPGTPVHLTVDWERRYQLMRHHSAAHLAFYLVLKNRPGILVKGCRIDTEAARFDFATSERLTQNELEDWEGSANEYVDRDFEIIREAPYGEPEAQVWKCGEMVIPCGGTHVRSTSELGKLSLQRKRQGANLERLYIRFV